MPHPQLLVALTLGLLVAALSIAARRLRIATPILMLGGGILLTFVPDLHLVAIDPDLVLLVMLPPLLYSGVGMSWRGFRASLGPILFLPLAACWSLLAWLHCRTLFSGSELARGICAGCDRLATGCRGAHGHPATHALAPQVAYRARG